MKVEAEQQKMLRVGENCICALLYEIELYIIIVSAKYLLVLKFRLRSFFLSN